MRARARACVHACVCVCVYVCLCVCVRGNECVCVAYVHACVRAYVCTFDVCVKVIFKLLYDVMITCMLL